MDYIAVYRREEDPELDGVPVALFRDGALMGDWHRVTNGVFNREPVTGSASVPDTIKNRDVAGQYEATAPVVPKPTETDAYAQAVADAKMRLQQEARNAAAEAEARAQLSGELSEAATPTPQRATAPIAETTEGATRGSTRA